MYILSMTTIYLSMSAQEYLFHEIPDILNITCIINILSFKGQYSIKKIYIYFGILSSHQDHSFYEWAVFLIKYF